MPDLCSHFSLWFNLLSYHLMHSCSVFYLTCLWSLLHIELQSQNKMFMLFQSPSCLFSTSPALKSFPNPFVYLVFSGLDYIMSDLISVNWSLISIIKYSSIKKQCTYWSRLCRSFATEALITWTGCEIRSEQCMKVDLKPLSCFYVLAVC